ncbi:VOC family protein [Mesobacterium sp. TK19101]|uniref:VOC family protein n=1 Tax=Mesobacterium hydrothermale TaxID=3111907 RepID=A0ABU6HEV0_9RHOB|nr:VOC family protein [Mesobacterium sp. TK19101]MEC3861002.1 VOC family protein [Mesobacterium sp. TK19101]
MQVTPYLFFPGTCEEAVSFYAETLGLPKPRFFYFEAMPPEEQARMPGVSPKSVMNCALDYQGQMLFLASDDTTPAPAAMAGCSIHLALDAVDDAHRVFATFASGGEIGMPMAETFWTPAFGTVKDRFGIRWMVSVTDS